MTTTVTQVEKLSAPMRLVWAWRDMKTVTWRNLLGSVRTPEAIFFSSLQPIMFVLLFRYVFGGAIPVPGGEYVNYLMPGIFVQTVCFGSVATAIGLAEDLQKGLIERFRALPMARSAVLGGRTTADAIRNVVALVILTVVGILVGFRLEAGVANFLLGCLVMLIFAYALSWGFSVIGLIAPNSETAQLMTFPLLFPLTFASGAFSPVEAMPGWLRGFATWQPVGTAVAAARSLMVGGVYSQPDKVYWALGWSALMLVVFSFMAVRIYRKAD
jgi:ABC-2 type transport system permease protein/oleandomycin transport system permease protein